MKITDEAHDGANLATRDRRHWRVGGIGRVTALNLDRCGFPGCASPSGGAARVRLGRLLLRIVTLALLGLPVASCMRQHAHPDVLLITVDTLRADHLSAYGFELESSPEIDALAVNSVLFERAIAAASLTVPSHTSIMTSRYVREHSVGYLNGKSQLKGLETLADRFRAAGYSTGAFIGNILLTRLTGLDRGFDVYDDELSSVELNRPHVAERLAEPTTRRAIEWLTGRASPVFLWVHYQEPHGPYSPPEGFVGTLTVPRAPNEEPLEVKRGSNAIPPYLEIPGLRFPSEYRSRYAEEIRYADHWIGELVRAFDERPGAGVVLLTADHGESFGESGRWFAHIHTTGPEVAHVPFILRAPGLEPSRRAEVVHHIDVLPTLLDLAGIEIPKESRGVALGSVLRGERKLPERTLFCDNGDEVSAYDSQGFVRAHGLKTAWEGGAKVKRARRYSWTPGEPVVKIGRAKELPPGFRAYAERPLPMERPPPVDPEALKKRLQALGYAG
jgi:arylsulfatase A-like enzyme